MPQEIGDDDFFTFFDRQRRQRLGRRHDRLPDAVRPDPGLRQRQSFDLFSFEITPGMLNPSALTSTTATGDSDVDNHPYFTYVKLRLNGRVTEDDDWTLGLRHRDYTYEAEAGDGLYEVAQELAALLPSRYTVVVSQDLAGNVFIEITDPLGFDLVGITANGLQQNAYGAADVTRTQTAQTTGAEAISFTDVDVTLSGTAAKDEIWTIWVGGARKDYVVTAADIANATPLAEIAKGLRDAINLGLAIPIATATGATVHIGPTTAFTLAFSVTGQSPQGTATFDGDVSGQDQAGVGEAGTILWTTARIALPATGIRVNEIWTVTLTNAGGGSVSCTKTAATTSGSDLATALDSTPWQLRSERRLVQHERQRQRPHRPEGGRLHDHGHGDAGRDVSGRPGRCTRRSDRHVHPAVPGDGRVGGHAHRLQQPQHDADDHGGEQGGSRQRSGRRRQPRRLRAPRDRGRRLGHDHARERHPHRRRQRRPGRVDRQHDDAGADDHDRHRLGERDVPPDARPVDGRDRGLRQHRGHRRRDRARLAGLINAGSTFHAVAGTGTLTVYSLVAATFDAAFVVDEPVTNTEASTQTATIAASRSTTARRGR